MICRFDEILFIWPLTSRYDLELGPTWPNVLFCTLFYYCYYLYQILSKSDKAFARYGIDTKVWWNTVYKTFNLPIWPWPWTNMAKCFALHIVLLLLLFVPNIIKIGQDMELTRRFDEILSIWPLTSPYDLDLEPTWPNVSLCTLSCYC